MKNTLHVANTLPTKFATVSQSSFADCVAVPLATISLASACAAEGLTHAPDAHWAAAGQDEDPDDNSIPLVFAQVIETVVNILRAAFTSLRRSHARLLFAFVTDAKREFGSI
eukprot:CAMPEP_0194764402 /NCGR_PEP_ID=MMETSP0323_2-20130528/22682_1 /TAXON_ID=2866 ORGANISM="Crypthecodinium cohnii, Strain Seligo" /NCGR_SAMPLE_ID=MMETSP0323_2 /ASSEMBLY_ACC=CAM_ASM_000346 /LENGTH=111 /DNA_ID=CAMNT_0039691501 /DNA_START=336 /DNA_END=671 /DNA_ORIENTATION=-